MEIHNRKQGGWVVPIREHYYHVTTFPPVEVEARVKIWYCIYGNLEAGVAGPLGEDGDCFGCTCVQTSGALYVRLHAGEIYEVIQGNRVRPKSKYTNGETFPDRFAARKCRHVPLTSVDFPDVHHAASEPGFGAVPKSTTELDDPAFSISLSSTNTRELTE